MTWETTESPLLKFHQSVINLVRQVKRGGFSRQGWMQATGYRLASSVVTSEPFQWIGIWCSIEIVVDLEGLEGKLICQQSPDIRGSVNARWMEQYINFLSAILDITGVTDRERMSAGKTRFGGSYSRWKMMMAAMDTNKWSSLFSSVIRQVQEAVLLSLCISLSLVASSFVLSILHHCHPCLGLLCFYFH